MNKVILSVGGERYQGWQKVTIVRSMEQIAHSFSLTLTDAWTGAASVPELRIGQRCEISIDNQLLITGFIDDIKPVYGGGEHSIEVSGYSAAADLLNATSLGETFKNENLLQIAKKLLKPFKLSVSVGTGVDIGKPFTARKIDGGQPPLEFLISLAKLRGVLLISDERGNLVITKASTDRLNNQLKLGINIKKGAPLFSAKDVFSEYVLIGQSPAWNKGSNEPSADVKALVKSDIITDRHRPLVIRAEGPITEADAKKRIEAEKARREGKAIRALYTVPGWRVSEKGELWDFNKMVPVDDSYARISDDMLIAEVRLILDNKGERVELVVTPPAAFEPELKIDSLVTWVSA